jgi:carboxypeptidase family protein
MNFKRFSVVVCALLVAVMIGSPLLIAQNLTTGGVAGVVTDPSHASVPDAGVTLKDNTKGTTQEVKTNASGAYQFYLITPGPYTLTITSTGFRTATRNVIVNVGQITTVNVTMSLATAVQTVTVTEAVPLLQTENGNELATLNEQQVSQVPNPGNDLSYIAQIAPGTVMNTQGGFGNFSANGMPGTSNLFTLNGMDDNDPFLNLNNSGATNLLLGQNEVQEATVVSTGYTGQYGGLAGSNVNYITKSGGNEFHGNAIWYWNGSYMNANGWFNNAGGTPRPFTNANQWAASLGGPIKKDKLFFFFNTEGLRVVIPTSVLTDIPTVAFEQATITQLTNNGLTASIPFYQNMFSLYNNAPGANRAVNGASPSDPIGCAGFSEAGFGTPATPCTRFFRSTAGNFTHEKQYAGRVDYNMGAKDRIFLRMQYDQGLQATFTDPINPLFNTQSDQPEYQGQLSETHTFGPTATNQIIISGQWYSAIFLNANQAATLNAFPTNMFLGDGTLTALGGIDFIFPQGRNVTQYQLSDDYTKTFGRHTVSFGGKYRRNDVSDHDYGFFKVGELVPLTLDAFFNGGTNPGVFTGTDTNPDLSVLIQSFPTSLNQPMAVYGIGFYVQDAWRAKSNLTFTLSLRAEHPSNPICQHLCFSRPVVPFSQLNHDPSIPFNQALSINQKQALPALDNILWQPRFGFAWQPFGSGSGFRGKTVVRGGIGIFYDAFPAAVVDNFSQNPPFDNTFVLAVNNLAPTETTGNLFNDAANANNAFTTGFLAGQTAAQIGAFPTLFGSERHTHAPQYQKWSLAIQQGLGANTSLSASYIGNHGIHESFINNSVNAFCDPTDPSELCAGIAGGFKGLPLAPPDSRFSTVSVITNAARSNYNGMVVSFTHRFTRWAKGIVQTNYTWSHAFDEVSNGGLLGFNNPFSSDSTTAISLLNPQDPNNIRGMYGPADYDVRHYFNTNYVLEVPFETLAHAHGRVADEFLGGWQVSGAVFARSGVPFTVVDSVASGALSSFGYGGTVFATFLGGPVSSCNTPRNACLKASQFTSPSLGGPLQFGIQGRNRFRGPKYWNTDFTIGKNTKIPGWERGEFGLSAQFFNFFNHPNFNLPVANVADSKFGTIQTTVNPPTSILGSFLGGDSSPRMIQLKLQFRF